MPNTSSGAAAAKPGSRSVPVVRPRRTGSLTTTAARGMSPVQRAPGSGMPCSTTCTGDRPQSQYTALNLVTCTIGQPGASAIGWRVLTAGPGGASCSR